MQRLSFAAALAKIQLYSRYMLKTSLYLTISLYIAGTLLYTTSIGELHQKLI